MRGSLEVSRGRPKKGVGVPRSPESLPLMSGGTIISGHHAP